MRELTLKIIITIDTEADDQWHRTTELTTHNIDYIPRFQSLCNTYGLKPTYLCTYEIAQDQRFQATLARYQSDQTAEIGAHLHPWSNPPWDAKYDGHASPDRSAFPTELTSELFTEKLAVLSELLTDRAGIKPTSYRAGRWGFSADHIAPLLAQGYLVDCSITPYSSWTTHIGNSQGGPDFRTAPFRPYFLNPSNVLRAGTSNLLELPVTIFPTSRLMDLKLLEAIVRRTSSSALGKAYRFLGWNRPQWFRPYPTTSAEDLIHLYNVAKRRGMDMVEMVFHSSELMPAGSPYYPTEASVDDLYATLTKLFEYVSRDGAIASTLTEYRTEFLALHPR